MALPPHSPSEDRIDAATVSARNFAAGTKVLAFVQDEESATVLRAGLSAYGDNLDVRRGDLRSAIRFFEKEPSARVAIVDISGERDPASAMDDLAKVCPPFVQVVAIGDNKDIEFYRLMVNDIGVLEYLPKPLTRDSVQRLLKPRLDGAPVEAQSMRGGQVVVVCGARGGVGATTVAVTLAMELADSTKGHVALLDLHLQDGATALMLSTRLGSGLRTAFEDPQRADELLIDRMAVEIAPRLRLLGIEGGFSTGTAITEDGVTRVVDLLRQKFNYVVIDLPSPPPRTMVRALTTARQVVVVLGPDVASVRDTKALRGLVNIATGSDRVITVLNRADLPGGLSRSLIERGLGGPPDVTVPDFGKKLLQAFNLGVAPSARVPALRRCLAPLLREVAGTRGGSSGRSWLKRIWR